MVDIQKLERRLNQEKNRHGLVGAKRARVFEFADAKDEIAAHINPQDWGIEIILKKGYDPIQDNVQKRYAHAKGITDGLETMVLHLGSLHEVAHWELPFGSGMGCPFDIYNHDKIVEGIKIGLTEKGKNPGLMVGGNRTIASYMANAFEDTIIDPRCKEYNGDFSGQVLFWDKEGLKCEKEKGKKGFTPLYEAFVRVNMHLWGGSWDKFLVGRHYTKNSKVRKAVKGIINALNFEKNISNTSSLFERENWKKMAEVYAREMSELLDEMPQEKLSAYNSRQSQGSGGGGEKENAGNGIEKKVGTKEGKEGVAYGRYVSGENQSPNFESFEQLDSLYQRLARSIPVKVESVTKDSSMEISPLNYRPFDPQKDNLLRIKTSKFFFDREGFHFAYPNQPLTIDFKQKVQKKSFPDFKMVVIDNSGSMKYNPRNESDPSGEPKNIGSSSFIPWGDGSKYHFALLGYYGIENFLQNQGIAPYIKHGVSLFSSGTRFRKGSYNELLETRKLLLRPDWGGTNLDAKVLKEALDGQESFMLSISDGDVSNWSSEKSEIKKLIEQNYYAHIQLGEETAMTSDLGSWGVPVFFVNSGVDLSKLMVDITKKVYHPFVQEETKK